MEDRKKPEVEIVEAVEVYSVDPKRLGKKDTLVTYKREDGRTYFVTLPSEEATEVRIVQEIKKAEAERDKLIGKKFEV